MINTLMFRGALYERVAVHHPLKQTELDSLVTELRVARAHLKEIVSDAKLVSECALRLTRTLDVSVKQISDSLKDNKEVSVNDVLVLSPDGRQEACSVPLHSMEKANRMLNYTVDAAIAAVKTSLQQIDTLVDISECGAARFDLNAPTTSRELTEPMVMTDNPADEVPTM
jgi:hypothetical protein